MKRPNSEIRKEGNIKIIIPTCLPKEAVKTLRRLKPKGMTFEIIHLNAFGDKAEVKRRLIKIIKKADAVLSVNTMPIDAEVLNGAEKLKCVVNCGVGLDHIDCELAEKKGVVVENTPSAFIHEAVADFTIGIILNLLRHISPADRMVKNGGPIIWNPDYFVGRLLREQVIGIIGLGNIGIIIARRLVRGFGVRVIYYDQEKKELYPADWDLCLEYSPDLDDFLKRADILTVHIPLTLQTYHLIGKREFSLMKKGVIFINTSRGGVVDEEALVRAVKSNRIEAVGLDVFEGDTPPSFFLKKDTCSRIARKSILTPHIAGATDKSYIIPAVSAVRRVLDILEIGRD